MRCVLESAFEAADMGRWGVVSSTSRVRLSVEFGRLDIERVSGSGRWCSVDGRGVEKTSAGGSCWGGRMGEAGEELAEVSSGSRAYSSLKMLGSGICMDGNCGRDSRGGEFEG